MGYYCVICKETISKRDYEGSMQYNGAPLCVKHQKTVTPQALKLSKALDRFDIKHILEYDDGFKHVDIAIEWAKIYIELDGSQHAFSPKQMCADDERDKYSLNDGFVTRRFANIWVDQDVDRLALSIATLANKRYREILENTQKNQKKATGKANNKREFGVGSFMKNLTNTARTISEKLENFE